MSIYIKEVPRLKIYKGHADAVGVVIRLNEKQALIRMCMESDECDGTKFGFHTAYKEDNVYATLPLEPGMAGNQVQLGSVLQIGSYSGPSLRTSLEEQMHEKPAINAKKRSDDIVTSHCVVKAKVKEDNLMIVTEDHESRKDHIVKFAAASNTSTVFEPNSEYRVVNYRRVHEIEREAIRTQTRSLENIKFEDAVKYVREPFITASSLTEHLSNLERKQFSAKVPVRFIKSESIPPIYSVEIRSGVNSALDAKIYSCLTYAENMDTYNLVHFSTQGTATWRIGTKLTLSSKHYLKHGCIPMRIVSIREEGVIMLRGESGSETSLEVLCNHNSCSTDGKFQLGPAESTESMKRDAILEGFEDFWNSNHNLFLQSIGRATMSTADLNIGNVGFHSISMQTKVINALIFLLLFMFPYNILENKYHINGFLNETLFYIIVCSI